MRSAPTTVEAAEWIESNIPPDKAVEHEPEILFDWLLPRLDRAEAEERAEWALVLMPNAEVFLNYAANPTHYSAIDWYPLESVDTEAAVKFYERVFGQSSLYTLAQRFQRQPSFSRYSDFGPRRTISDAGVDASRNTGLPVAGAALACERLSSRMEGSFRREIYPYPQVGYRRCLSNRCPNCYG